MIIYKVTNLFNGKIYIGKTIKDLKKRKWNHYSSKNDNSYFHNALKKYPKNFFIWEIIDESNCEKELNELEKKWIKFYDSTNPENGYNLQNGGSGRKTYISKKTTNEKISKSLKGKMVGEKNPFYGKKHTEEAKKKMSRANKPKMKYKPRTKEHAFNNKIGQKTRKEVEMINSINGKVFKIFNSLNEASLDRYGYEAVGNIKKLIDNKSVINGYYYKYK